MKINLKIAIVFLIFPFTIIAQAQNKESNLLKELADNACKCIDSINLYDRVKKEVILEIHDCIDDQTGAYQMGDKLMSIDLNDPSMNDSKKQIDISVNMNKDSQEYKNYYYELERFMMGNCEHLKVAIASNEKQSEKSFSQNPEAVDFYRLGIAESKSGNFEKAIDFYKKAIKIDPDFAFAWDNIGIAYRRLEKYDLAIDAYEKSLEIDPYGAMPLQNIAIVYQYTEEYEKAIKAYERYGAIHPENPEYYYGAGRVYAVYLNQQEKGLDYICKAYNIYIDQNSPYRTDAEQVISVLYSEMKKKGKEDKFFEILKTNKISIAD